MLPLLSAGFLAMLVVIATESFLPLSLKKIWHHDSAKLALSLLLGIPVATIMVTLGHQEAVLELMLEYTSLMVVLFTLYTIVKGVLVAVKFEATPVTNALVLLIGSVCASVMGTTGATILFGTTLLQMNRDRENRIPIIIFAIFMIANVGGMLLPIGDPPLLIGYFKGVPFLWTLTLVPIWGVTLLVLAIAYLGLDIPVFRAQYPRRSLFPRLSMPEVRGKINILFLVGVALTVAVIPSVDLHGHEAHEFIPWREITLLCIAGSSFVFTRSVGRERGLSYRPMREVAILFLGIFLTMGPALFTAQSVARSLPVNEWTILMLGGFLSSFLDNAPTYATLFEGAKAASSSSSVHLVAGVQESYLVALSAGTVQFGAMTPIGNAPNLMLLSLVAFMRLNPPNFIGFMRGSAVYCLPVFLGVAMVFIMPGVVIKLLGVIILFGAMTVYAWPLRQYIKGRRRPAVQ